jgi:hypothetical protein
MNFQRFNKNATFPSYKEQRKPIFVMNEQSFPNLSKCKKSVENVNIQHYKDKLIPVMADNINNSDNKVIDELPEGWISIKKKDKKVIRKEPKVEEPKVQEEKEESKDFEFDVNYLMNFMKKRRENYIKLYGEDNYKKIFGPLSLCFGDYEQEEDFEININSWNNHRSNFKEEKNEDISSIE